MENSHNDSHEGATPQSMTGGCSNWWSSNECLRGAISINVICKLQISDAKILVLHRKLCSYQ